MLDEAPSNLTAFPLPPATPASSTYPCQLGSQHAKNNFRPRKFARVPSSTESQAALRRALQKYWGHKDFRGPQLDICTHALRGCDVLVVAPTGLGKSVCFQVPAVTIEYGITIVVSPLLALMRDQVTGLRAKGIQAFQLSEKTEWAEVLQIRRQMRMGHPELRLLYVTPETLFSSKYSQELDIAYRQKQLVRLVVDEAHVIDEWGSTFRPTYRRLGEFRSRYPTVPITALTASATSDVRDDLLTILNMPKTKEQGLAQWVEPFNRKNLFYEIRYQGGGERQQDTLQDLCAFVRKFAPEGRKINDEHGVKMPCVSGLVYCRLTADCDAIAAALNAGGVTARPFYARLSDTRKNEVLDLWKAGGVECIVATIAFGMGVDQAHVRYVVHYDMPKSFEGYYQETGRAGRDGHRSRCVLYYSREDAMRLRGLLAKEAEVSKKNGDSETFDRAKLRMLNSFKALQHFAESTSVCRHISICRYFGETIDTITDDVKKTYCDGMCDVCVNRQGVFHRSSNLNEEVEVASPIIRPVPLEPTPEYFNLSAQAGQASLAVSQALRPTKRIGSIPISPHEHLATVEEFRTPKRAPPLFDPSSTGRMASSSPPPTAPPVAKRRCTSRQPSQDPQPSRSIRTLPPPQATAAMVSITPVRPQTIDQLADESGTGAVVILGDRSPEHNEKRRKARESAFKSVVPVTGGGPYSFYNSSAPRKKGKVGGTFRVPAMPEDLSALPSEVAVGHESPLPPPSAFVTPQKLAVRVAGDGPDRGAALKQIQAALRVTFVDGELAEAILGHWGRQETDERRALLLRKVARELELDMAKMAQSGEPYDAVVKDTCDALKLLRDPRGVALVLSDRFATMNDARIERLRHVETCFRTVRVK